VCHLFLVLEWRAYFNYEYWECIAGVSSMLSVLVVLTVLSAFSALRFWSALRALRFWSTLSALSVISAYCVQFSER